MSAQRGQARTKVSSCAKQPAEKANTRHFEPAVAGGKSLFVFCFDSGGILRFAQNDNQIAFPAACNEASIRKTSLRPGWRNCATTQFSGASAEPAFRRAL
jgi:hypothetical protein